MRSSHCSTSFREGTTKIRGAGGLCATIWQCYKISFLLFSKNDPRYKVIHCMFSSLTLWASSDSIRVCLDLYCQKKQNGSFALGSKNCLSLFPEAVKYHIALTGENQFDFEAIVWIQHQACPQEDICRRKSGVASALSIHTRRALQRREIFQT